MIPQPTECPACKCFLEDLLELLKDLEIDHISAHSDEQVYDRLCHIIWKKPTRFQAVILLMGDFHQLTVRQKTIFKRHNIMGYHKWLTDAGVVAAGYADAAVEGRHYYSNMRISKELFCVLVQHKVETLTSKYQEMDFELKNQFIGLTQDSGLEKIAAIMKNEAFNVLFSQIMDDTVGTETKMTIYFLKDFSSLLALVSAVRENDFERALQGEREMV